MWQTKYASAYLKIWEWELIFGRAVKAISSPGVRSPCVIPCQMMLSTKKKGFFLEGLSNITECPKFLLTYLSYRLPTYQQFSQKGFHANKNTWKSAPLVPQVNTLGNLGIHIPSTQKISLDTSKTPSPLSL